MQPFYCHETFWKSAKTLTTLHQENILNFVLLRFTAEKSRKKKKKTSILDHTQRATQIKEFHIALCSSISCICGCRKEHSGVRTSSGLNQPKTCTALTSFYCTVVAVRMLAQSDFSHSIHTPKSFEKLAKVSSKEAIRSSISLKTSLFFINLLSKIGSKRTRQQQFRHWPQVRLLKLRQKSKCFLQL